MKTATAEAEAPATPLAEKADKPKASIIIEGKEIVLQIGQEELPGMPEATRLRRLGLGYVTQWFKTEEAKEMLDKVKQEILMELRDEGRSSFAMRENGVTYIFNINAPQEKLEVKKKR